MKRKRIRVMAKYRALRNRQAHRQSFWDWSRINQLLEGKASVSDLDGTLERNCHLLVLETKRPGDDVSGGQRIMFDSLTKRGDLVLVIWGPKNYPRHYQVWGNERHPVNRKWPWYDIERIVLAWWNWASGCGENPKPWHACALTAAS